MVACQLEQRRWSGLAARYRVAWEVVKIAPRERPSSLEVVARGFDAISITMRAARQAFSD
jgi:hypothetical protein